LRLIERCDVLIEGFRPGVMARLGLDQDRLLKINPALVTCSITGYGQDGPLSHAAGHDINYLSFTGVLQQNAGRDGKPAVLGLQVADLLGGTQAAVIGILAALYDAKRGAMGRHVDISMTDVVFGHNLVAAAHFNETGQADQPGHELLTGGEACYNVYTCADGRHMAVGSLEAKFWDRLCQALGREDLMPCHWSRGQTPGSASARAAIQAVADAFLQRDQAAWTALLDPLDCCVTPILTVAEALQHPLFAARQMVETIASAEGVSTLPAFPIRFVGDGVPASSAAKARGADQALLDD
jgi:crotonobetainyl-CoA:carnitine CoA-transferase CaiB-like acyl-CoA transferase